MAKFNNKVGGKEIGNAAVYAEPHDMTGKAVSINDTTKDNMSSANHVNMSVGNISRDPDAGATKTDGIKIRGTGAATKGTMARGPMA